MTSLTLPSTAALRSSVSDKVVIVTGAASGIGKAIAQLFAEHDATVILADLDLEQVTATSEAIHGRVVPYQCDVSSWEQQLDLFSWVVSKYGPPDVVCCNAGIDPELATVGDNDDNNNDCYRQRVAFNWLAPERESTPCRTACCKRPNLKAPSDKIWEVNFKGVLYGIKLARHHMDSSRGGNIIVTGSAGSYIGIPGQDIYAATKHALLGLVRSTSQRPEIRSQGFALSMVCPWLTETPLVQNVAQHVRDGAVTSQPEDVAWAVAELVTRPRAEANGKCVWVRGKQYTEVEEMYSQWVEQLIRI